MTDTLAKLEAIRRALAASRERLVEADTAGAVVDELARSHGELLQVVDALTFVVMGLLEAAQQPPRYVPPPRFGGVE